MREEIENKTMNLDLNYMAGFCDADGCITMSKIIRGGKYKSPEYKTKVIIANTKIKVLELFKKEFGGKIQKLKNEKSHHKDRFLLHITNQQAYKFCKLLKEKLFLKKRQAEIIIKFYEKRIDNKSPLSKEELNRRKKLLQEMKKLNKRGKNENSNLC